MAWKHSKYSCLLAMHMQGPKVGLLEQLSNKVYNSEPDLIMKRLDYAGTAMNETTSYDKETRLSVPRLV
jgi:hypothetical protein